MIVYIDASALVKRYVAERGSRGVTDLTATSDIVATTVVSRAEVAAALARAARLGALDHYSAAGATQIHGNAKRCVPHFIVPTAEPFHFLHVPTQHRRSK